LIDFYGVSKSFPGGQAALLDVSFHVDAGEFVFLTGPSGAGKTTLLRLVYREDTPSAGSIVVNGRSVATLPASKVPYLRRSIGIVFQSFRLIERKTVFENVAYLPRILGAPVAEQRRRALEALGKVGLGHRMSALPKQLSGGEQQRVAIARALVSQPDLLLADEPTGNLDPDLSLEVLRLFRRARGRGTTVLLATHDRAVIERFGGRVLVLDRGRLVDDRTLDGEEPLDPAPAATPAAPSETPSAAAGIEPSEAPAADERTFADAAVSAEAPRS
jgi:cell division transport system ATP-binding protein